MGEVAGRGRRVRRREEEEIFLLTCVLSRCQRAGQRRERGAAVRTAPALR